MNSPFTPERSLGDANLRGWSAYCRDVSKDRLPQTILHVCQAVYDAATPGQPIVTLKLAVLDHVARGDCHAAVEATMPPGVETRLEQLAGGKVMAELRHPVSHRLVTAEGKVAASALLGCLVALSLTLDPSERLKVFG